MAYARWGDGPRTMLYIPGGPGNAIIDSKLFLNMTMKPLMPLIEDGFSIWVVARKQNMPTGHTVEDMAADYAELIKSDFGGRVDTVVGGSYGGLVAQYVAANHADCFDHIVVTMAACEVRNSHADLEFARLLSEGRSAEGWTVMANSLWPNLRPQAVAELVGRMMARMTAKAEHEYFRHDVLVEGEAEFAFDARPALPRIEVPVLMLNGGEDHYFPRDLIEETERLIPDCTSQIYEGKSHVQATADERLAQDIREFVNRA